MPGASRTSIQKPERSTLIQGPWRCLPRYLDCDLFTQPHRPSTGSYSFWTFLQKDNKTERRETQNKTQKTYQLVEGSLGGSPGGLGDPGQDPKYMPRSAKSSQKQQED